MVRLPATLRNKNKIFEARFRRSLALLFILAIAVGALPASPLSAAGWQALVGAQDKQKGIQALAFLPNELWIHVGDSVTWTFATDEPHTLTFLGTQNRPPFQTACVTANNVTFPDAGSYPKQGGGTCPYVNSGFMNPPGTTYTITFDQTGNFQFVCLLHPNMTGTVHVLASTDPLPHDQAFYDRQAKREAAELLEDGSRLRGQGLSQSEIGSTLAVVAGIGDIRATGGGFNTVSVLRFLPDKRVVHVGDTVEWTNLDPVTPHTITFGSEPGNPFPPTGNVSTDPDGARHVTLNTPYPVLKSGSTVNSGFIMAQLQPRNGEPTPGGNVSRFRVTFTAPGTYKYYCALHDELGMIGELIVMP